MEAKKAALSLEGGVAKVSVEALAGRDSDLALRLGWLGMRGEGAEREAGKALAKAALREEANRPQQASRVAAEAFAALAREGDLGWAGGLRDWARRNAEKLAGLCGKPELDAIEAAYPGWLESLPAILAADFPRICEGLLDRGKMRGEALERMLAAGHSARAAESAALCASRQPEETARAWGRLLVEAAKPAQKGEEPAMSAWSLAASWGRMGKEEARLAAEGLAAEMAEKRVMAALGLASRAAAALGDPTLPEGAEAAAVEFLGTLARECAGREIGKRALPWAGERSELVAGRMSMGMGQVALAQAQKIAEMPAEWAFLAGGPGAAGIRDRMALAWWRGWSEGGGEEPGLRLALGREGMAEAGGKRFGMGALGVALGWSGKMESARFILIEGLEGMGEEAAKAAILEGRGVASALERIGGRAPSPELAALLEEAEVAAAAGPARRASSPRRRL